MGDVDSIDGQSGLQQNVERTAICIAWPQFAVAPKKMNFERRRMRDAVIICEDSRANALAGLRDNDTSQN